MGDEQEKGEGEGGGMAMEGWWGGEVLDVVCGEATGVLHKAVFYCPGIQQACIELPGGELVTPKTFTVLGNKAALKNWKTAIRSHGVSLRRLMEMDYLDFHDHAALCTGRCMTRSGTSKYDNKMHALLLAAAADRCRGEEEEEEDRGEGLGVLVALGGGGGGGDCSGYSLLSGPLGSSASSSPNDDLDFHASLPLPLVMKGGGGDHYLVAGHHQKSTDLDLDRRNGGGGGYHEQPISYKLSKDGVTASNELFGTTSLNSSKAGAKLLSPKQEPGIITVIAPSAAAAPAAAPANDAEMDDGYGLPDPSRMTQDSSSFWQSIAHIGLLDDFVKEIKSAVDALKADLLRNRSPTEASAKLSSLVVDLGLDTKLKYKLMARKHETERLHSLVDEEVDALRQRLTETEQRQQELKRKSDCFGLLFDNGRSKRVARDT